MGLTSQGEGVMMENTEKKYYERSYKLASENTKYNSEGKAVITLDDEWREEKEWDAMFNQIQMEQKNLDQMEVIMRLFDFLSFFDESTMVKIIDNDEVLMECKVGEVTQRLLNCRFLIKSYIENGALFVHTEVKQQDDMLDELE